MPEIEDLPHLVRLLDDENPVVRSSVENALGSFGDGLYAGLRAAGIELDLGQRELIDSVRPGFRPDRRFDDRWDAWRSEACPPSRRLEIGLGLLSWAVRGDREAVGVLGTELDALAGDYLGVVAARGHVVASHSLAEYLFGARGFSGDEVEYYSPRNSDLLAVLERGSGNPISLACLYRLVGHRAGLDIGACNFPGHFMAKAEVDGKGFLVDCFNGGRFVLADDLRAKLEGAAPFLDAETSVEVIVRRAAMNLVNAYARAGEGGRAEVFRSLVKRL